METFLGLYIITCLYLILSGESMKIRILDYLGLTWAKGLKTHFEILPSALYTLFQGLICLSLVWEFAGWFSNELYSRGKIECLSLIKD